MTGHWLMHWLGLTNASGPQYLFLSGAAGDLSYLGALGLAYRKLCCHQRGCWRLGHYTDDHRRVCRRHHPIERHRNG